MSIALLLIGDGRDDVHDRCWESAQIHLPPVFDHKVVVDDRDHELGFAGAIKQGWDEVLATGADWCFWLEADFLFQRDVPIARMLEVLRANRHLVQIALLRGPENPDEHAAGGIIPQRPGTYFARDGWIEHRNFFTTNPNLLPTWVMRAGWPQEPESEGKFGINLFASDNTLRSAFWGNGETWVEHVGQRVGVGY
jgi:hypothetical protein